MYIIILTNCVEYTLYWSYYPFTGEQLWGSNLNEVIEFYYNTLGVIRKNEFLFNTNNI